MNIFVRFSFPFGTWRFQSWSKIRQSQNDRERNGENPFSSWRENGVRARMWLCVGVGVDVWLYAVCINTKTKWHRRILHEMIRSKLAIAHTRSGGDRESMRTFSMANKMLGFVHLIEYAMQTTYNSENVEKLQINTVYVTHVLYWCVCASVAVDVCNRHHRTTTRNTLWMKSWTLLPAICKPRIDRMRVRDERPSTKCYSSSSWRSFFSLFACIFANLAPDLGVLFALTLLSHPVVMAWFP